jgi:hypothetical protein
METNLVAEQPEQTTAAPAQEESTPSGETQEVTKPVETPKDQEPEWFVKRIGEFTAKYRQAERERDYYRQQVEQLQKPPAPKEPEPVKTLADFNYDEGKFHTYLVEEARKAAKDAAREADTERSTKEQAARRDAKFAERVAAFRKDNPDAWEAAITAPINERVVDVIKDLENGPELAAYLGKNPDLAEPLNGLPERVLAIELGRIDARLSSEKAAKAEALEKAKAEKSVSQAPPPAPKLEGNNAQVEKDPSQMTDAEFAKWRKRQIAQRR